MVVETPEPTIDELLLQPDGSQATVVGSKVHSLVLKRRQRRRPASNEFDNDDDIYDESHRYELEEGENRLRLVRIKDHRHHSILDDTQDITSSQEESANGAAAVACYPSILSLASLGYMEELEGNCRLCLDVDGSTLAIKDMQLPPQSTSNSSVTGEDDNGAGHSHPLHAPGVQLAGIWRKETELWERLPLRQLRILQPGDRVATAFDKHTKSVVPGGLVLEYEYGEPQRKPSVSALGLLTQPLEDEDNEETQTEPSKAMVPSAAAPSTRVRCNEAAATTGPSDHVASRQVQQPTPNPDSDDDSDQTMEITQTNMYTPTPGQPSQTLSTLPMMTQEEEQEEIVEITGQDGFGQAILASKDSDATEVPDDSNEDGVTTEKHVDHGDDMSNEEDAKRSMDAAEKLQGADTAVPNEPFQEEPPAPTQDSDATEVPTALEPDCTTTEMRGGDVDSPTGNNNQDSTPSDSGMEVSSDKSYTDGDDTKELATQPLEDAIPAPSSDAVSQTEREEHPGKDGIPSAATVGEFDMADPGNRSFVDKPNAHVPPAASITNQDIDANSPAEKQSVPSQDISMSMLRETGEGTPVVARSTAPSDDDDSEITDVDGPMGDTKRPNVRLPSHTQRGKKDDDSELTDVDDPLVEPSSTQDKTKDLPPENFVDDSLVEPPPLEPSDRSTREQTKDPPPDNGVDDPPVGPPLEPTDRSTQENSKDPLPDNVVDDAPVEPTDASTQEHSKDPPPDNVVDDPPVGPPFEPTDRSTRENSKDPPPDNVVDDPPVGPPLEPTDRSIQEETKTKDPSPENIVVKTDAESPGKDTAVDSDPADNPNISILSIVHDEVNSETNDPAVAASVDPIVMEETGDGSENLPKHREGKGPKAVDESKENKTEIANGNEDAKEAFKEPDAVVMKNPTKAKESGRKAKRKAADDFASPSNSNTKKLRGRKPKAAATPQDSITTPSSHPSAPRSTCKRTRATPKSERDLEGEPLARVMATGVTVDKKMVGLFGGELLENLEDAAHATHVIAASVDVKLSRTPKLMVALSRTDNIVHFDWLKEASQNRRVISAKDYLLVHNSAAIGEAEKKYKFKLSETLDRARKLRAKGKLLFHGLYFFLCPGVAGNTSKTNRTPSEDDFRLILEGAGAKVLSVLPDHTDARARIIIVTSKLAGEKKKQLRNKDVAQAVSRGAFVKTTDEVFHAIMTQKLDWNG